MFRSFISILLVIISITLSSCSVGVTGLKSYVNPTKGYEFLYPNGWIPVDLKQPSAGVDLVLRDLIERTENLSVIISDVPADKSLEDLGTPSEVGYRFLNLVNDNPSLEIESAFLRAESRQAKDKTYYLLEYEVDVPDQPKRHNLASVAVSQGQLFTFNLSTPENRWETVRDTFEIAAQSFSVR